MVATSVGNVVPTNALLHRQKSLKFSKWLARNRILVACKLHLNIQYHIFEGIVSEGLH